MKIQIFSDSLALPREIPQKVYYEETYSAKLSKNHIVAQYSKGAGTIKDLLDQTFYYKMFCPDVIILQSGIVDCSPRPFTQFEEHFLPSICLLKDVRQYKRYRKIGLNDSIIICFNIFKFCTFANW